MILEEDRRIEEVDFLPASIQVAAPRSAPVLFTLRNSREGLAPMAGTQRRRHHRRVRLESFIPEQRYPGALENRSWKGIFLPGGEGRLSLHSRQQQQHRHRFLFEGGYWRDGLDSIGVKFDVEDYARADLDELPDLITSGATFGDFLNLLLRKAEAAGR